LAHSSQYHDQNEEQEEITAAENGSQWNILMLYAMKCHPNKLVALFPETYRLLNNATGTAFAFFSILDAGRSIPPHEGRYLGCLCYQLVNTLRVCGRAREMLSSLLARVKQAAVIDRAYEI